MTSAVHRMVRVVCTLFYLGLQRLGFFFFQAEDGIRDDLVTGVQTCALPISTKAPYGDVTYADPGYQADKQKRYPLDSEAHCRAAWSYINMPKNAAQYSSEHLAAIKGRIKAALKKYGVDVSDDSGSNGSSSRAEFMRMYPLEDMPIIRSADGGVRRRVRAGSRDQRPRRPLPGSHRPVGVQPGDRPRVPGPRRLPRRREGPVQPRDDDPGDAVGTVQHADRHARGDPRRSPRAADPDPVQRDAAGRRGAGEHPVRVDHQPVVHGPHRAVRPPATPPRPVPAAPRRAHPRPQHPARPPP